MAVPGRHQRGPKAAGTVQSLKVALAARIVAALDRQGLTVREAQARTGQAAADFSRLRGGQLERFTVERLVGIAEALGERLALSLGTAGGHRERLVPAPLASHLRELRSLCRRFAVRRLGAFGSVLRDDFDPDSSDIDLTVDFGVSLIYGPVDQYFGFKAAVERLLGREVDLVELRSLRASRLRQSIERTQVPVYEQAA